MFSQENIYLIEIYNLMILHNGGVLLNMTILNDFVILILIFLFPREGRVITVKQMYKLVYFYIDEFYVD